MFDHLTVQLCLVGGTILALPSPPSQVSSSLGSSDRHAYDSTSDRAERTVQPATSTGTISTLRMLACDQTVALLRANARSLDLWELGKARGEEPVAG